MTVTPQVEQFLTKAEKLLVEANTMLGVGLNDAAGRTAYFAGFHAAQALIFERLGKIFKTHHGVQAEFLRLTKGDPKFDEGLRAFLSRSYNLKAVADYETGPGSEVSAERAVAAIRDGAQFVASVRSLVGAPSGQTP